MVKDLQFGRLLIGLFLGAVVLLLFNGNYVAAQCYYGDCDDPATRDEFIPGPEDPIKYIRIYFQIFANDDGSAPAASVESLGEMVELINEGFYPYKIQFAYDFRFVNSTEYRVVPQNELSEFHSLFAVDPARQVNFYITGIGGGLAGKAVSPWDPSNPGGDEGYVIVQPIIFTPSNDFVIIHELGHLLGLHHTNRGLTQTPCGPCWELADGSNGDTSGDLCSDTRPNCDNFTACTYTQDPCFNPPLTWPAPNLNNFMSLWPTTSEFTLQQAGRMHCWFINSMSGWLYDGLYSVIPVAFDVHGFKDGDPVEKPLVLSNISDSKVLDFEFDNGGVEWLEIDPQGGNIQPGESKEMIFIFYPGEYDVGQVLHTEVILNTSDPNYPEKIIPVQMRILDYNDGHPLINTDISTINVTLKQTFPGQDPNTIAIHRSIYDDGGGVLTFDLASTASWLGAVYQYGTLPANIDPGDFANYGIVINSYGSSHLSPGLHTGYIRIDHNDPDPEKPNPLEIEVNLTIVPPCEYIPGDADDDDDVDADDPAYLTAYLKGGPPPPVSCECDPHGNLYVAGDANGSCSVNGLDVTYLYSYLNSGGPAPTNCPDCPPDE